MSAEKQILAGEIQPFIRGGAAGTGNDPAIVKVN